MYMYVIYIYIKVVSVHVIFFAVDVPSNIFSNPT